MASKKVTKKAAKAAKPAKSKKAATFITTVKATTKPRKKAAAKFRFDDIEGGGTGVKVGRKSKGRTAAVMNTHSAPKKKKR